MPTAANLRYQDYQFQQPTNHGYWKWTTRMDVTGPSPVFTIRDIISPFGILRDSIPIPGPVVQSMADSIGNLLASFTPTFLINPLTLTFTQDEGRGFGEAQAISITNIGVFGSLLDATVTTDAPYVVSNPEQLGNIASSETGQIEIVVNTTDLLAINSPYIQTVTLQDPNATNNPVTIPVTIVVRPKAAISVSTGAITFYVTKPLSGPYPPIPAQSFTLTNTGDPASLLDYVIQRLTGNSPWLSSYNPTSGQLAGGGGQLVTVAVAPPESCPTGTYTEKLRISGYSSNSSVDVTVTLVIS